jgi:hypothetical protein
LQLGVTRFEFRRKTRPQAHDRGCLSDEIFIGPVDSSLVGDPQVLSAPATPVLGITCDRIPKGPAIEERGQEVKQNSIIAAIVAIS